MKPEFNRKPISDPTFNHHDFIQQLSQGRLRWLATILAAANIGLLIDSLVDKQIFGNRFSDPNKGTRQFLGVRQRVDCPGFARINWPNWFKRNSPH
jgi:hypothetical protein